MLIILNMQKRIKNHNSDAYIPSNTRLIKNVKTRLNRARKDKETIIYGIEYPLGLELMDINSELKENFDIVSELTPNKNEFVINKDCCTFSPKNLGDIKAKWYKNFYLEKSNKIEVAGVELNRCVLANILLLKSIFPRSSFVVDRNLVYGPSLTDETYLILENFDVEIRN